MRAGLFCLALVGLSCAVTDKEFGDLVKTVQQIKNNYVALARQVSQQQLYVEESTRASGDSGLKATRLTRSGSKSYFSNVFSDSRFAAIHDHSNYQRTIGMGELVAVLNGVEFRTRHNDYKLVMPSKSKKNFGATDPIPMPEVPPEVLAKKTLDDQIAEMKEWFKAWQTSDFSKRDYRKYFKANLCYLEGMWTEAGNGNIEEPFASDRHSIAAKTFFDLTNKIKYTSAVGRKEANENYAYLPTTISDIDEHGNVKYSQWSYKILCHPLERHVPLTRFAVVDDLANRVANGKTLDQYEVSRMARFRLYDDPSETRFPKKADRFISMSQGSFLEDLMSEIPGKDNYPAEIYDTAFNLSSYDAAANLYDKNPDQPLNVGYYNRRFRVQGADAMGAAIQHRGYSDKNLFVAYNTQQKVTPVNLRACKIKAWCSVAADKQGKCVRETCVEDTARVSYAVPLEIIYTTPLQTWNPYKVKIFPKAALAQTTNTNNNAYRRNGQFTEKMAYAGASPYNFYYLTPTKLYESTSSSQKDSADTAKYSVGVLDSEGKVQKLSTSGISIHTRSIPDVGVMRIRYPIMPLHQEGSLMYKEVDALKDMSLMKHTYGLLYPSAKLDNGTIQQTFPYEVPLTWNVPPGPHQHTVDVTMDDINLMKSGKHVTIQSSVDNGHDHKITLRMDSQNRMFMVTCDGRKGQCWDGHRGRLYCPECRFQ